MADFDRVVTLDDLVESVPEELLREAEKNRIAADEIIDETYHLRTKEPQIVSRGQSKAQRIREYLEANPEARNKDVVEVLQEYKVTAADVANVKSLMKRSASKASASDRAKNPTSPVKKESTAIATVGPSITIPELEAGVNFIKSVGSVTRAKHVLIIIEQIKDNVQ